MNHLYIIYCNYVIILKCNLLYYYYIFYYIFYYIIIYYYIFLYSNFYLVLFSNKQNTIILFCTSNSWCLTKYESWFIIFVEIKYVKKE